jgi:MFS family permease
MNGPGLRALPYLLSFFSSLCIMVLELVASRLVARHVGGSLIVWTSVIGIMLGGICLGNVLGGRLADRVVPRRAIGPLYGLGALMVLLCLWVNAVVGLTPGLDSLPWDLRTLVVVTLNFLVPGTILGMISPVVAKMAVEQASKPGSAVGYVYMLGAIGSIVGTFLAGFYLMYLAPTSTIVTLIAAAYCLLAAMLFPGAARGVAAIGAVTLGVGGYLSALSARGALPGIPFDAVGSAPIDLAAQGLILVGHALTLVLAIMSVSRISGERAEYAGAEANLGPIDPDPNPMGARTTLWDLAALSFLASLAFMALEMVAGRLVTRHTGSSIYGWTSVIGVLLGGLSLGNFLGGKVADHVRSEKKASWLFLAASVLTACVLLAESPPRWLVRNPIGYFFQGADPSPLAGGEGAFLHQALGMTGYPWWFRILFWTTVVFFVPALTMGTVSPVVAKLAVDRLQRARRTGTAIGQVYAWGMVGSILGTFLTGFFLIDLLGTKGLILALSALLALAAFVLGGVIHAIWAGIPIGLCLIAFLPVPYLQKQAENFGIVE